MSNEDSYVLEEGLSAEKRMEGFARIQELMGLKFLCMSRLSLIVTSLQMTDLIRIAYWLHDYMRIISDNSMMSDGESHWSVIISVGFKSENDRLNSLVEPEIQRLEVLSEMLKTQISYSETMKRNLIMDKICGILIGKMTCFLKYNCLVKYAKFGDIMKFSDDLIKLEEEIYDFQQLDLLSLVVSGGLQHYHKIILVHQDISSLVDKCDDLATRMKIYQ